MYHYEKKLDATYKHYQHHPYVKENKKKEEHVYRNNDTW